MILGDARKKMQIKVLLLQNRYKKVKMSMENLVQSDEKNDKLHSYYN